MADGSHVKATLYLLKSAAGVWIALEMQIPCIDGKFGGVEAG